MAAAFSVSADLSAQTIHIRQSTCLRMSAVTAENGTLIQATAAAQAVTAASRRRIAGQLSTAVVQEDDVDLARPVGFRR